MDTIKKMLLVATLGLFFSTQSPLPLRANEAEAMLVRCMAAYEARSSVVGAAFRKTIDELSTEERKAFADYLKNLLSDVALGSNHLTGLDKDKKEKLLTSLLDATSPQELIDAFFAHAQIVARLSDRRVDETFASALKDLQRRLPAGRDTPPVEQPVAVPLNAAPQIPDLMVDTTPVFEPFVPVDTASTESPASTSPMIPGELLAESAAALPLEIQQDKAAIRKILEQEALGTIIGEMFERNGVRGIENRMLALLIFRLEATLSGGRYGDVGMLTAHPERFNTSTKLKDVFRDAENAIRTYAQAEAKIKFYLALLRHEPFKDSVDIPELVAAEQLKLNEARENLAPHFTIYLGIKAYLEETVGNPGCGVMCRVGALHALSNLGQFDLVTQATLISGASVPSDLAEAIALHAEKNPAIKALLSTYNVEFSSYKYFDSVTTYRMLRRDADLQALVKRATNLRGGISFQLKRIYNSNAFRKLATSLPAKFQLDKWWFVKGFTQSFAEESRDQQEKFISVGTLLILTRANIDIQAKMSELEALAAYHPAALVTLHRHSLFRMLLDQINTAVKDDDDASKALKFKFSNLLDKIAEAKNDPDAKRLIDISTEPSWIGKVATAGLNTVTLAYVVAGIVAPAATAEGTVYLGRVISHHFVPFSVVSELTDHARSWLGQNPEGAAELRNAADGAVGASANGGG